MSRNDISKEHELDESDILLSVTDLDSRIKYANPTFLHIAGYSMNELEAQPHKIIRHKDMPKAAFADLWQFIQNGHSWMGPVKNLCKNGDYYWVNGFVTPIKDLNGKVIEYQSVRTKLDPIVKKRAECLYKKLNNGESPSVLSYSTDLTFWFQSLFFLFSLVFSALVFASDIHIGLTLPFLFISLISSGIFMKWRKRYLKILADSSEAFDNPLMSYIYSGTNDSIGRIELALSMRKAEINAVVGRVSDISSQVTNIATTSAVQSKHVSESLNEQRSESEQVATAVNEMSATVNDLAHNLTNTAESTEHGKQLAVKGQQAVDKTIFSIEELSVQLKTISKIIINLSDESKTISNVLSEISGIADQTNLLALNAAIEAARAGEQGRGFAVVADEVRALAVRTQNSTNEIRDLLTQLQLNSEHAVESVEKGNALSNVCVCLSKETGEALFEIDREVSLISDATIQIATAIEEQSVVTEQVSQNVVRINDITIDCEQNSVKASDLSTDLLKIIDVQSSLIKQFKR